jgi:dTMP kinase
MDAYALDFHQRVRNGYHELASRQPARWRTIDASQPPEMVQLALRKSILERLNQPG